MRCAKLLMLTPIVLAACSTQPEMGSQSAKTTATGAAAGGTATGENSVLEKCGKPLGTLAITEDQGADWFQIITHQYHLPPTANVLRLLVQQSNCFVVVERGAGFRQMTNERALQASGELRSGSSFGKGQMVSADYGLTPSVVFSSNDAGGLGAALGGLIPGGHAIAAVAGSVKFKEAQTMLTLVDNRSGVQIGAAEGSSSKTDFGLFGGLLGGGAAGGLGGYTKTPEGKMLAAAFTDAYNQLVKALRNYKPQEVQGGLGTGGQLKVQGSDAVRNDSTTSAPGGKKKKKNN